MLMERSATCMTLIPLLASRAMPSGEIASMATMPEVMRVWGVGVDGVLQSEPVSIGTLVIVTVLLGETFLFWCVLMCLDRWSLLIKRFGHSGHANFFSPVCVRLCRCSSSLRVKRFPQYCQVHTKGRSPVCHRKWARKWEVFPYTLPHPVMWQMCCFFLPGSPDIRPSLSLQYGQVQASLRILRPEGCVSGLASPSSIPGSSCMTSAPALWIVIWELWSPVAFAMVSGIPWSWWTWIPEVPREPRLMACRPEMEDNCAGFRVTVPAGMVESVWVLPAWPSDMPCIGVRVMVWVWGFWTWRFWSWMVCQVTCPLGPTVGVRIMIGPELESAWNGKFWRASCAIAWVVNVWPDSWAAWRVCMVFPPWRSWGWMRICCCCCSVSFCRLCWSARLACCICMASLTKFCRLPDLWGVWTWVFEPVVVLQLVVKFILLLLVLAKLLALVK